MVFNLYLRGTKKFGLFLIPGEWYSVIPNGFEIVGLNFIPKIFIANVSDDDTRFGCLPYGVIREINYSK